ncbi:porin [Burkholderia sp. IT-111MI5]|uniref:porin n=1 Tax=Burkholderia sp. IT-111MI5 TaxID=3026439 RepID=UPI0039E13ED0
MSSRDLILSRLRGAGRSPQPLLAVPLFDRDLPPAIDAFKRSLDRVGGVWCDAPADGDIEALIRARFPDARTFCSAVPEVAGTRRIEAVERPHDLNDVDVGIVRPAFAVAETGSLYLSEREYRVNALGYGTVTVGRQFDSTLQLVQPFALGGTPFGGVAFAHPFDNDNLANYTRSNNAVKYSSPLLDGFRFGATYGFSNAAGGFADNRGYALAATYERGAFAFGTSYLAFDHEGNLPPANADGMEPAGAPFNAARQRTVSAAAAYTWGRLRISAIATRTRLDEATSINNVADTPVVLHDADITFRNAEVNACYALTRRWTVAAAYTFTVASFDGPSGHARPNWQQAGIIGIDALSPRTDAYAEALFQHANGLDGTGISGAQISNFSRASGANQLVLAVGMRHRF